MPDARVLIVEDEFLIALELKSIVESLGAEAIGPVLSVEEALELARDAEISAAILDLRLSRRSIAPVARCLRARRIPFFFYSGQMSDPVLSEWSEVPFVAKPATPDEISQKLKEILAPSPIP